MALAPEERVLDDARRIHELTGGELTRIASAENGWSTLYRDPSDGRHWELTYPLSHMHGGGPPRLAVISLEEARAKYGV